MLKKEKTKEDNKMEGEIQGQGSPTSSICQSEDNVDGDNDTPELICYADVSIPNVKINRFRTRELPLSSRYKKVTCLRMRRRDDKRIYLGRCLGNSSTGAKTYLAMDHQTGNGLIAKKWILPRDCDFKIRYGHIVNLKSEFATARKLSHRALVPYDILKIGKLRTRQCIFVFRPLILGASLKSLMFNGFGDQNQALKLLRKVADAVLGALSEMHRAGVYHGDIRPENVYLDELGDVKIVGIALDARSAEMLNGDMNYDKYKEAQDIYASGQLFRSIVSQNRAYVELPQELPAEVIDFLSRFITNDERSTWSANDLLKHIFLRDGPARQITDKDTSNSQDDDDAVKKIQKQVSASANVHSRLNAEFESLACVGKGAYGVVLKVKNKLDGRIYAIKRIKLNPKKVQFNKITREVELLSRLNHENVVRYYNAWIESTTDADDGSEESSDSETPRDTLADIKSKQHQEDKLERTMSVGSPGKPNSDTNEDDDDYCHEYAASSLDESASDSIQFKKNSNESHSVPVRDEAQKLPCSSPTQFLYIQMQFCEKNTLSHAIANGLYQQHYRAWRLFREIVGGLAHVHQQGMIHRDLKPMNIFLDSNDHVKIGDFGLATDAFSGLHMDDKLKRSQEFGFSLTGQVGTALYAAPELLPITEKSKYKESVDIYSLGIILFEMFHPPLATGMERVKILTDLRTKDIILPRNFDVKNNAKQIYVIRWLLNHEASLRPTCAELLSSEHVPRPGPGGEFLGLLNHALSDRGARGYELLVSACLDQRLSAAEDYAYYDVTTPGRKLEPIRDAVVKILRSHGANAFSPPLLTHRTKAWDQFHSAVKVMTSAGHVCHLPFDLRLPFARHTAYYDVKRMRRYVVDRVYRENLLRGGHPYETFECAFDIVTPKTASLWPDAELLVVASRAAAQCNLKVSIQLNHTDLMRALLQSCGVPLDKHKDIYPLIAVASVGDTNSREVLKAQCRSGRMAATLMSLLDAEVSVENAKDLLPPDLGNYDTEAALKALRDLQNVCDDAKALGCKCRMTVAPFRAYNARHHSGVFWQMFALKSYQQAAIATGGRYDELVEEFRQVVRAQLDKDVPATTSVGFTMALQKMTFLLEPMKLPLPLPSTNEDIEVVVSGGAAARGLARRAWAAGLRAVLQSEPAVPDYKPSLLLRVPDDTTVFASFYDGIRTAEEKFSYKTIATFIRRKLNPDALSPKVNHDNSVEGFENGNARGNVQVESGPKSAGHRTRTRKTKNT